MTQKHQNNLNDNNFLNFINDHKNKTTSSSKHYSPYQRSTRNKYNQHLEQPHLNLHQVELGIVDGSSLNPSKKKSTPVDTSQKTGLLTKCVDWLFKIQPKSKKNTPQENNPINSVDPVSKKETNPIPINSVDFNHPPHSQNQHTINPISHHSNMIFNHQQNHFNSLLNRNKSRSTDKIHFLRSQSPFVSNHLPILNSSSSSSSLRSINNNIIPKPRRPSTSHATLQIPISSRDPKSIFNPHLNHPSNSKCQNSIKFRDSSVRSPSPLSRRSPSAQIIQSSSFSHLTRLTSPRRTLNSTLGLPSTDLHPTTQTLQYNSLGHKRSYDQMSISPTRPNQSPQSRPNSSGLFQNDSQPSKKQMFYDPTLGFATLERRDKILRENEMKLRQEQGRPFPTNEAEKILQVLEVGPDFNPFLKNNRQLPSISVPTPSTTSAQRRLKMNGANALTTDLEAIYEEQALQSNPTIIAPISKKLNAERLKRLADKKGQLRAEIKKRKMFEESLKKQSLQALDHLPEPNDSTNSHQHTTDSVAQRSTHRALRCASVETASELAASPPRRRSSRKIGKLTSDSSKAKINQGRKSRSQSVNEEDTKENHENEVNASFRLTRSSAKRTSTLNGSHAQAKSANSNNSETISKAFKSRNSPSPIQEEDEDLANQSEHQKHNITVAQHTTCLHPSVRSSSISLQTPTSIVKSSSNSSLRPGRTFSSRRHAKARVFSALEDDLPPLNDEDDEEADQANEKLKKIKLPSTFISSFKLDKFTPPPPPPPEVDVQTTVKSQETQEPTSTSNHDSSKKSLSQPDKLSLFGQSLAPNTASTPAFSFAPTPTPAQSTISMNLPSSSKAEESAKPPGASSTFFSLPKDESVQSGSQPSCSEPLKTFDGFSRIPSEKSPPNFFRGITSTTTTTTTTQPTSSDASVSQSQQNKSDEQPEKNPSSGLFSFQSATSSGATTTSTSSNSTGLFKFTSESNNITPSLPTSSSADTPNVAAQPTETSANKPLSFAFGTQTNSQSVTGSNGSVVTPAPTLSGATSTNKSTKTTSSQPPPTVPAFTFGGVSNPPVSIFGSQPEPTKSESDPMKPDPVPIASSVTPTPFSSSTFVFGSSQSSSETNQITNTQSESSQSDMFGTMRSTTQPAPSIFGNANTSNAMPPVSSGFNFNATTKPATQTLFGGSSQQTPVAFTFGASTTATSNLTTPTQSTVSSGLFGTSSLPVASGGGPSSAPPISFTFGNPSSSNGTSSSPFVFGANNSSGLASTPAPTFGQAPSNTTNSTSNVFTFGAGNASSSSTSNHTTQNQNQTSNGMFSMMSGNNTDNNNQNSLAVAPSNTATGFNFGATNQGFNNNNNIGLFGNSSGGVQAPTNNLFGSNNGIGLNGANNNKSGLFGANSGSLFGSSPSTTALSLNNNNDGMMETNPTSNSIFGAGAGGNNGNMGVFGNNANNSNGMTTTSSNVNTNSNGFNAFGNSTANTPQSISFGSTIPMASQNLNGGNSDLNLAAPNPAPGGFVFNMGSSGNANNTTGTGHNSALGGRNIKKLPGLRKTKR